MAKSIIIQVALVMICCAGVAQADARRRIKDLLDAKCKSHDPIGCIKIAQKEYNRIARGWFRETHAYEDALEEFLKLADVISSPDCSSIEYYYPLSFIEYSSIGHRYHPDPESLSPFDSLMHFASLKRAEGCREVYIQIFDILLSQVNVQSRELVEGFRHRELVEDRAGMSKREYMEWLIDYEFWGDNDQDVNDAVDYVLAVSAGDPDRSYGTKMYEKYLKEPCLNYNAFLYNPLAKQMRFDAEMFQGKTFYHLEEDRADTLILLYQCMARTQFCRVFSIDTNFLARFVRRWIFRAIEEQSDPAAIAAPAA